MRIFAAIFAAAVLSACSQSVPRQKVEPKRVMEIAVDDCKDFGNVARMFDDSDVSAFVPEDLQLYSFRLMEPMDIDSVRIVPVSRRGYSQDFRIMAMQGNRRIDVDGSTIVFPDGKVDSFSLIAENRCVPMLRREYYHDSIPYVIGVQDLETECNRLAFRSMEFYHGGRLMNDSTVLTLGTQHAGSGLSAKTKEKFVSKIDGNLWNRKVCYADSASRVTVKFFDSGDITVLTPDGGFAHIMADDNRIFMNGYQLIVPSLKLDIMYDGQDGDFINLRNFSDLFLFDIRYATSNNFTHQVLYPAPICWLRYVAARDLVAAARFFKTKGVMIKMFDGYRPHAMQYVMWYVCPNPNFLSPPSKGSIHNRGGAVDLTLAKPDGSNLDMGTDYDFCGPEAYTSNMNLPMEVLENRHLLSDNLARYHFNMIRTEWWHFSHSMARAYDICEFVPKEFIDYNITD